MEKGFRGKKNDDDEFIKQTLARHLDAIIDSSFDGLWICNGEGRVIRVNRASEKMNNIKAEQVLNRKMEDIVREGLIDRSVTLEVMKHRTSMTMVQKLKNGKQVLVTGNPIFDSQGDLILVLVNDRDITELNKLRTELEETRALSREYRMKLYDQDHQMSLFSDVIVRNRSMQGVFNMAMKVAQVDSIVLIQGESGVGKSLLAKLIHRASKRKEGPFIRVDCGAIPESLIESELFGYEGGAFTGARTKGKPGHFAMAEGGTLFLDEIGELPLNVQVKLLRFIEDSEVVSIGSTTPKTINTRIIAATNRDLDSLVNQGLFRKDLFFRLHVIPITIPPLKERKDEIPAFIHFFLQEFNRKCGTERVMLPRAVDQICKYPFPGNIRELANLMEQLVVLSPNRHINVSHLPKHLVEGESKGEFNPEQTGWNLRNAVGRLEKEMVTTALRTFGSQKNAAVHLGMDQSTLARKAKRYGIRSYAISHLNA